MLGLWAIIDNFISPKPIFLIYKPQRHREHREKTLRGFYIFIDETQRHREHREKK
jgi:hypothetical protein